ncbi:AT-rich interactive domain-containing protein 3C-like isoform X5 [Leptopilina heterotoma]|uniref:AT-rich interactive domain-containing protein 3C-like isoform X5 n=1 Tax=Leptopilina heterotoma TaxID=63436 RepID=UPI001CA8E613|nr:AT-rich interactive domain-containing protein 3C-like isoform X5 [Leptopilina heterotoma]
MEISDEYQDIGNTGGGVAISNMPIPHHGHTSESPMSHQEEDLSDPDLQDEESGEELPQQPLQGNNHSSQEVGSIPVSTPTPIAHLNNLMNSHHPHFLAKLKMENDLETLSNQKGLEALQAVCGNGNFSLPFSFPMPPAFLPPHHHSQNSHSLPGGGGSGDGGGGGGGGNAMTSSASSHSSESSQSSARNGIETTRERESSNHSQNNSQGNSHQQQTSWSFEEQFKQVRQNNNCTMLSPEHYSGSITKLQTGDNQLRMLYEINNDPSRKEFLDDLFSFMQKRGTPINRLPIMAKSVLDLYELYNLVIARGGLVDVINKKLWQEIIKGLHLPSSITSAAFTLRTQYMKYLYPYECDRRHLSTPAELQAAIDGNRREGRRSSYGAYGGAVPGLVPPELEARMFEYIKHLNKELMNKELKNASSGDQMMMHRQGSASPPTSTSPRDGGFSALEMSRLTMWNLYNNNSIYPGVGHHPPYSPQQAHSPAPPASSPEPQREALDLGLRSSPLSSSPQRQSPPSSSGSIQVKNEQDLIARAAVAASKRLRLEDEVPEEKETLLSNPRTNITISNRGDGRNGDNSLVVSIELNGTMYQGVLFAQSASKDLTTPTSNSAKTPRTIVS